MVQVQTSPEQQPARTARALSLPVPAPAKLSPSTEAGVRSGTELSSPGLGEILPLRERPHASQPALCWVCLSVPGCPHTPCHPRAHRFVTWPPPASLGTGLAHSSPRASSREHWAPKQPQKPWSKCRSDAGLAQSLRKCSVRL